MKTISLLLALLLVACSPSTETAQSATSEASNSAADPADSPAEPVTIEPEAPARMTALEQFVYDPFDPGFDYSMIAGDVMEKILERFGSPDTTDVWTGEGGSLSQHTLEYRNLRFVTGAREQSGTAWLESIEISGDEYELKSGLRIGSNREQFVEAFELTGYVRYPDRLVLEVNVWEESTVPATGREMRVDGFFELTVEFDESDSASVIRITRTGH